MEWFLIKEWIEVETGLSRDALHIAVGLLLHLTVAALLRRPIYHPATWLTVVAAALANEVYDLWYDQWTDAAMQRAAGLRDIAATIVAPLLLALLTRFCPRLFTGRR